MKTAPWIIIIVLLSVIFFMRECTPETECPECPEPDTVTVIKIDTFFYPVFEYIPKIVFRDHFADTNKMVDTNAIIAEYMIKNYYSDTITNDSSALIIIQDTVTGNRIIWRRKQVNVFPATIYNTQIVTKKADPLRKLFVGVGVGRSATQFGLAPSLLYVSKKDNAYSLSYDILNQDLYFTLYWKLNFKNNE